MKYSDLIVENATFNNPEVINIIKSIALALLSNGHTELSTDSLIKEIQQRTGINIPYNVMMNVLESLPFIASVDEQNITLTQDTSSSDKSSNSPKKDVTDMATSAAVSEFNKE